MTKQKIFILLFILAVSQKCFCQIGPSLNTSSSGGQGNSDGMTLLFSAINATMTTMNLVNISTHGKLKSSAGFGIITGFSQVAYGLIYAPKVGRDEFVALNVGVGTVTIVTSCLRLIKKEKKNSSTSWNFICVPINNNKFGAGISLTRKI